MNELHNAVLETLPLTFRAALAEWRNEILREKIMLRSLKRIYGEKLDATDGEIGTIKDFYFDDLNWVIRYLVVDTSNWLASRKVLISPHSLASRPASGKVMRVGLTRKRIERSPSIGSQNPVLRDYEQQYYKYYGWPPYWTAEATNMVGPQRQTAHLRSTQAVNGYLIRVGDETIGHVCDFMVETKDWAIGQLVVKTGHRLSGSDTLMSTKQVDRINHDESTVSARAALQTPVRTSAISLIPAGVIL